MTANRQMTGSCLLRTILTACAGVAFALDWRGGPATRARGSGPIPPVALTAGGGLVVVRPTVA